ncbi:ankyrin repeat-containing domain protein [Russula dissimulans]|nr:ankyrin repeat-containing domain protein [Russula dissimulans]
MPLVAYAAQYWVDHAQFEDVSSQIWNVMEYFFEHLVAKNPEHVNARGGRMVTPLTAALYRKYFRIADLLSRHGADVDARGRWEETFLHAECREQTPDLDVVEWLLGHGVDVNAQNDGSCVPLPFVADTGYLQLCRILFEHNADINARNRLGETPSHRAVAPSYSTDPHDQPHPDLL